DIMVNHQGAAKKYSSGHVLVTVEVEEIVIDKRPRIRFKTPERKRFVEALFSHRDDMKEITKESKITVRGECEGWQKNVIEISLCKVVKTDATAHADNARRER